MKKIYLIVSVVLGVAILASCQKDEKTTLQAPETFVLNTPSYVGATYDLENSSTIRFTTSQPDYGFTASTEYSVQVSIENNFTDATKYQTLATTTTSAVVDASAAEMATALTVLSGKDEIEFPIITKAYVRLKANLKESKEGVCYSNVVTLPSLRVHFALPPVEIPSKMYFSSDAWSTSSDMVISWDKNEFWKMQYLNAGDKFQLNSAKSADGAIGGSTPSTTITDNAGSGLKADGSNFTVTKSGWYLLLMKIEVVDREYVYSFSTEAPKVYLTGDTAGSWEIKDEYLFTVPETADGDFVSPAFVAAAEARACVKLPNEDWWHSEFIVLGGQIAYRGAGDDQDRVSGTLGGHMTLNFAKGTGKID